MEPNIIQKSKLITAEKPITAGNVLYSRLKSTLKLETTAKKYESKNAKF